MDKRVFLHVGLHKTGTTFLQERVFPALEGVRFVHPLHVPRTGDGPIERFMLELFFRNAAHIDYAAHREAIYRWIEDEVDEPALLISSEALVGWPIENHANFCVNTDRLAEIFPDAKVMLVVRRQDKWVNSAYNQLLKAGFSTSIERYLNYRSGRFDRYNVGLYNGPNVDARDLDWGAFDAYYRQRFGEQSVLTLPFELFGASSEDFLARIYAFMGLDAERAPHPDTSERVNQSWSPLAAGVARVVNKVPMPIKRAVRDRVGSQWHPAALVAEGLAQVRPGSKARAMPEALAEALMQLHRDNNRRLGERIGVDLSEYGY
ncbi:sulfotransferase [Pseudenhygromyxa sp. WMMC2535]|uniref:sulfotransferase n=1 Tax=Pseudenhygromyxa sp. WMMC2535 TaxID=2712867 RepID=UPI0015560EF6|nr:sulfotransferase [Pseudenhygromyxa sp. WMMC2535]NVB40669.1 sulfotransferase [Pseudenhygromyxa sp. WMMC2535]